MKAKKLAVLLAVICAACGGKPAEKVDRYVANKNYTEALAFLTTELNNNPKSGHLNGLMAEVLAHQCVNGGINCLSPQVSNLQRIGQLAAYMEPLATTDKNTRNSYQNLLNLLRRGITDPNAVSPAFAIAFAEVLPPESPKNAFAGVLTELALPQLESLNQAEAQALLAAALKSSSANSRAAVLAGFLNALLQNNTATLETLATSLKERQLIVNDAYIAALPYAFYLGNIAQNPQNGATTFATTFKNQINALGVPQFSRMAAQKLYATTFLAMSENQKLITHAVQHTNLETTAAQPAPGAAPSSAPTLAADTTAPMIQGLDTPTTQESDLVGNAATAATAFRLYMLKTSLMFNPEQRNVWQQFLQPAVAYVAQTGNADVLFPASAQLTLPEDDIAAYNKRLFELVESRLASGQNILPLVEKIIIPAEKGAAVERKVASLVEQGLNSALNTENVPLMVAYASFRPNDAKPYRQQIVTLTIKAMEDMWQKNAFDNITPYATFLTQRMEVDFNLDNLLLQNLNTYMAAHGLEAALNEATPSQLLLPQEQIAFDFGDKFAYVRTHFASRPEQLDNLLKGIVTSAQGQYGVPTTMYKLWHLFNNATFPPRNRDEFLTGAIKKSLSTDTSLSALQMATTGTQLVNQHPAINLMFVIGETLRRITTLDEALTVWHTVTPAFQNSLRSVRPQFVTLMEAIDLFNNGQKRDAAQLFSRLTDKQYIQQAEPYLKAYTNMVNATRGVYVATDTDTAMHTFLLMVAPVEKTALSAATTPAATTSNSTEAQGENVADPSAEILVAPPTETSTEAPVNTPSPQQALNANVANLLNMNVSFINAVGSVMVKSHMQLVEDHGQTFKQTIVTSINPDTMTAAVTAENRAIATLPQSFEKTFGTIKSLQFMPNGTVLLQVENSSKVYQFKRISQRTDYPLFPEGRFSITQKLSTGNDPRFDTVLPIGSMLSFQVDPMRPIQPTQKGKKLSVVYPVTGYLWHPASLNPRPVEGFYTLNTHTITFNYSYPYDQTTGLLNAVAKCHAVDTQIICAAHNKHWSRRRFSHIVQGVKIDGEGTSAPQQTLLPPPLPAH